MQDYELILKCDVSKSYLCQRAADSLDIDIEKKSIHHFKIRADLESPYRIGLIIGASGSGKTTIAKKIFGDDCFDELLDLSKPVIEQFPPEWSYDDCAKALNGIGLNSVPCWIRPAYTLSNGQKSRAEAALQMSRQKELTVLDEWTSVVDRNVAKVMSHCVQKYARKNNKKIVLISCHYDVIEWINPDWIIDCNTQEYIDRRAMVGTFERTDQLRLDIREANKKSWSNFSKYHYLSENLPGGKIYVYGLFDGEKQIGFQCYAAYIVGNQKTYFINRTVIHPDYAGLGLGILLINETAKIMVRKGFAVKAKFSSIPIFKAMSRNKLWKFVDKKHNLKNKIEKKYVSQSKVDSLRSKTFTYSFDFIWSGS